MEFRTIVDIRKPDFQIEPLEQLLFVGSCFADSIGKRFADEHFPVVVNPYGVMYNPASVLHTLQRWEGDVPRVVFLTLGTNHVYRLRESGEIVDNCQKRPQNLFLEQELTVGECTDFLLQAVNELCALRPCASYFPAYEIVQDELRDYRFYQPDMLHPSAQAVEYIWERLAELYLSPLAKQFVQDWKPIKAALHHKPFSPESEDYKSFLVQAQEKEKTLIARHNNMV